MSDQVQGSQIEKSDGTGETPVDGALPVMPTGEPAAFHEPLFRPFDLVLHPDKKIGGVVLQCKGNGAVEVKWDAWGDDDGYIETRAETELIRNG
jgi:hypothetical protein